MYNSMNSKPSVRYLVGCRQHTFRNGQKGALLVVLIITMVVLSLLSGGIVYIFYSSTLNPVSGNYAQRAYYNAEAGFRYVTALYRVAGDKTVFNQYATPQTITLPGDGGTVAVSVTTPTTFATATAAVSGSNLVLSGINGTFPPGPGFFTKSGYSTVYRYTGINTAGGTTTLTGIFPTGFTGGAITTKEQTTITSKGTFGNGFWNVSRTVAYSWPLSGIRGGNAGNGTPTAVDMSTIVTGTNNSTGEFVMATHRSGNYALNVSSIQGGTTNAEVYGSPPLASGTSNPLYQAWLNSGGYLSYDLQVKVAEEHNQQPPQWNSKTTYNEGDTVWYQDPLTGYYASLIDKNKGNTPGGGGGNNAWQGVGFVYGFGVFFRINELDANTSAYGLAFFRQCATCSQDVPPTLIPPNLPDKVGSVLLFARDGSASNQTNWLAFMSLNNGVQYQADATKLSYVVDPYGFMQDWSSIYVRVVEAASIKLASETVASSINIGDQITGAGGAGTATVIRKIHDSDGYVVLLLNNVQQGIFTRPATVGTYTTTSTWTNGIDCTDGYCPKDNYIWAFYADTSKHPSNTSGDNTAQNNVRLEEVPVQGISMLGIPAGTINWTPTDIQAWANTDDHFTLVMWNSVSSNLNTGVDSSLRLMGKGKELNAIIRSHKYLTASTGSAIPTNTNYWTKQTCTAQYINYWFSSSSYAVGDKVVYNSLCYQCKKATAPPTNNITFPPEIGIIAKGITADQFFYDDLAYRIFQGSGGGTPYIQPIQQ